jgi:hypothetical protein
MTTKSNVNLRIPHGTRKGYQYYGCRCVVCKAANAEETRRSRDKRKQLIAEGKAA